MLKKSFLLILFLILCSFTGCDDHSDIETDIFVAGFAIDEAEDENFKFKVSTEVITTSSSGDSATIETKVISAEGNTVLEALSTMVSESSKELYFDHCQIMILGEKVAKENLIDILDLAFRDTNLRLSMKIIIAKNCKAYEILNSNSVVNVIKSYEIAETVKINSDSIGFSTDTAIFDLLNQLNDLPQSGICPAFTLKNDVSDEKMNILQGSAIFKNNQLAGFIENKQSQFCLIAMGKFKSGTISCYIPSHDQLMSIDIRKCSRKIETKVDSGIAEIKLVINMEICLPEIPTNITVKDPLEGSVIQKDISNYIKENVYHVVTDTIGRYEAEIFGFSSKLQTQQRDFCRKNAENWDEIVKNMKIEVDCNIKIKNSGTTNDKIYKGN